MRIIQISDTHLSPGKTHFADNWAPLADWIAAQRPDLVIHTGDVTVDGAGAEDDLAYSAGLLRGLGVSWRAVPGNHDVGDARHPRQPVTPERLAMWRRRFGPGPLGQEVGGGKGAGAWSGSMRCCSAAANPRRPSSQRGSTASWQRRTAVGLPGFCTGRCLSTAPRRATPTTGRSSLSRAPG